MTKVRDILKEMPKVDLHCHLDGSVRTSTILDLARKQNFELPADNVEDLREHVRVPLDCHSLGEFLDRFETFYPLLKSAYALERAAYELCRDCSGENTKYMEVRFAPVLQKTEDFSVPEVVKSVLDGINRGQREFDIKVNLILCLYRGTSAEDSLRTMEAALKYSQSGVCGIDVAGDETRFGLESFKSYIKQAKDAGLAVTIHAGEAAGPESIRSALDCGADRIGHGVALAKDKKLMDEVIKKEIPLEICLTSNVHTQVVKNYQAHPVRKFLEAGVKVTLNTDDRGVSGIDLTYEYHKARELGITFENIVKMDLDGIEYAFAADSLKKELKERFIKEIEKLKQD
ncbi:MAG: adenosine deaminase [Elusimicrobiota bacterium]|nr:adenosine deaminase [Elusimicrobiota bacterium]